MNVFELAAKLTTDTSGFDKGLKTADKSMQDFASKATKTLNNLKKVFAAVVSVAAVKKVANGIFSLANATSQLGDRVDKQSQALGMSRKAFQEWDYILSQSGASIDSMGMSMKTLNEAILGGGKEAQNAFKELGLSVKDLAGMSQEQAFEETVKALQRMPAGAQKSSLALKMFGRNAQSLMPLLNSSADSVEQLKKRAEELGLVMSDEAVDASVAYGDALDTLKRTMTGIKNTVGSRLLPALTDGMIAVTNYAGKFRGYVQKAIETGDWKGLFKNIGGDIEEAAKLLWIRITDTVPVLWENAQNSLLESDSPILQTIGSLMKDISDAIQYVADHKEDFVQTFNEITGAIGNVVTTGIETVKSVFEWLNEHGIETQDVVKGVIAAFAVIKLVSIASAMNPIVLAIEGIAAAAALIIANWDEIEAFFVNLWSSVSESANEAWKSVEKWFGENIIDPIKKKWDEVTAKVADIVDSVKAGWTLFKLWFSNAIITPVKDAWDAITTKVTEIVELVKVEWDKIVSWFSGAIISPISGTWDGVLSGVNSAIESVKSAWASIVEWFEGSIISPISEAWSNLTSSLSGAGAASGTTPSYGSDPTAESTWSPSWFTSMPSFGSHANGLSFVPENGYLAELHFGEAVLSRNEAEKWRNGQSGGDAGAIDLSSLTNAIVTAVRAGIESANIALDGESVTQYVSRRQAQDIMSRRFATV